MNKEKMKNIALTTLKLQPVIVLYSLVSIGSKLASGHIPGWSGSLAEFVKSCFADVWLFIIIGSMFAILFVYAVIWQICIKNIDITVMYANKSSYIFWTQLAAVVIFHERVNICNLIGIVVIFIGIMVVNSNE